MPFSYLEIIISFSGLVYFSYFILEEHDNEWKIEHNLERMNSVLTNLILLVCSFMGMLLLQEVMVMGKSMISQLGPVSQRAFNTKTEKQLEI